MSIPRSDQFLAYNPNKFADWRAFGEICMKFWLTKICDQTGSKSQITKNFINSNFMENFKMADLAKNVTSKMVRNGKNLGSQR